MSDTPTPALSEPSGSFSKVTLGGITVETNGETEDQIRENLKDDETSKAASTLGKKGAEARKAKGNDGSAIDTEKHGVASETDDTDGEVADGGAEKPLGKPRNDPRARMLEATRKEAEAKRERDAARAEAAAARAEAEAIKARLAPQPQAQTAPQSQPDPSKPRPEQFQTYEEFAEALADYKAEQKVGTLKAEMAQAEAVRQFTGTLEGHMKAALEHRSAYVAKDPQFFDKLTDEVIQIANKPSFARNPDEQLAPDHVIADEILLNGAAGPLLLLHLSAHPEEVQRLRALPTPTAIQVEMRLLARSLDKPEAAVTAGAAPKGDVSRAKPPVRPVTGSPHTAADELSDDMSDTEYLKKAMAKRKRA